MKNKYPKIDLESVVRSLEKAAPLINSGNLNIDRLGLLLALGYSRNSGPGQSKIAALQQYGFLLRHIEGYTFGLKAKRYVSKNTSLTQKIAILEQALMTPFMFRLLDMSLDRINRLTDLDVTDLAVKHDISKLEVKVIVSILKRSKLFIEDLKSQASLEKTDIDLTNSNYALDTSVLVDFGNGMVVNVPKKIILEAYLKELHSIKDRQA